MHANALINKLFNRVENPRTVSEMEREPRVVVDIPARIKSLNSLTSIGPSHSATVVEISQRGLDIRVAREFLPGSSVQVLVSKEVFVGKVLQCSPLGSQFIISLELKNGIVVSRPGTASV